MFGWLPLRGSSSSKMDGDSPFQIPSTVSKESTSVVTARTFSLDGFIKIHPEEGQPREGDLRRILQLWAWAYSGPNLLEGMVKGVLACFFQGIIEFTDTDGIKKVGCQVSEDITFKFASPGLIPSKHLTYSHLHRYSHRGKKYILQIELTFSPCPFNAMTLYDLYEKAEAHKEAFPSLEDALTNLRAQYRGSKADLYLC